MTEVAIHPRVALLRGYPKRRKATQQQPYSTGRSKQIDVKPDWKVPDIVAEWARTPRLYKPTKQEQESGSPPPFRRNITDLQNEDNFSDPARYEIDNTDPVTLDHKPNDIPADDGGMSANTKGEPNLPVTLTLCPEAPDRYGRKPVPTRPNPAPVLTRFLSEFIHLCTGHDTSSEYPRDHQYVDRSQQTAQATRPSSRLGFNREQSSALDCLQHIAAKLDEEKRKASLGKSHRYRREALVYGEEDEQGIADLGLAYSDEDEEEDARLLFAKTINALDSNSFFN